ncbi:MAG: glycerol-3-phosphate 1-O-acyltransferase PlsY [Gammaproteobacteria bacterium]|nr:glycerol-3-phosphate 1-O-acyltransferase PlsY [Gammaproteobacteria bacterium]
MIYLLPILGYLLGSVSSAVLVSRWLSLRDPRTVGSGNPGTTNVLREGGKLPAALTLLGDVLKGVVPVLVARWLTDDTVIIAAVAGAAFIGHLYPVFFQFKGGKGVATAAGVYLALNPIVGVLLLITWLAVAGVSRYSSLAALLTSVVSPLYVWILMPATAYLVLSVVLAALLIWRHHTNIANLIAGTENKIEF